MPSFRWLPLVCLFGLPGSPSAAQNALLNPDFDVDVAGWQAFLGSFDLDRKMARSINFRHHFCKFE